MSKKITNIIYKYNQDWYNNFIIKKVHNLRYSFLLSAVYP